MTAGWRPSADWRPAAKVYRVTRTVEVQADSPEDAVLLADDLELSEPSVVIQVRQEPFDAPSPMWNVDWNAYVYPYVRLRRLR